MARIIPFTNAARRGTSRLNKPAGEVVASLDARRDAKEYVKSRRQALQAEIKTLNEAVASYRAKQKTLVDSSKFGYKSMIDANLQKIESLKAELDSLK